MYLAMITDKIKTLLGLLKRAPKKRSGRKRALNEDPNRFLKHVSGVVHVGANAGQERELYKSHGLSVVWVEPIPEIFAKLDANLQGYTNQRRFQALVTDVDNMEFEFHVTKRPPAEADSRMRKYFSTTPSPSSVIPANLIPFALPIPHLIRS